MINANWPSPLGEGGEFCPTDEVLLTKIFHMYNVFICAR